MIEHKSLINILLLTSDAENILSSCQQFYRYIRKMLHKRNLEDMQNLRKYGIVSMKNGPRSANDMRAINNED